MVAGIDGANSTCEKSLTSYGVSARGLAAPSPRGDHDDWFVDLKLQLEAALTVQRREVELQLQEQHKRLLSNLCAWAEDARASQAAESPERDQVEVAHAASKVSTLADEPVGEGSDDPRVRRVTTLGIFTEGWDTSLSGFSAKDGVTKCCEGFVKSQIFEAMFVFMICLNAVCIAAQMQVSGHDLGRRLGFKGYAKMSAPLQQRILGGISSADRVFTVIFLVELTIRFLGYRLRWFKSLWNYADVVIVVTGIVEWVMPEAVAVDPTMLRLLRFAKLMRIVRVLRSHNVLESLHLLVVCLRACAQTLFWSMCVLLLIQVIAALFLSQLVRPFLDDPAQDVDVQRQVFGYYGTFWRSLVTMFEVSLANWAPACRLLLDNVGEGYGWFFLIYRCVIGFAVLSVIQAVFIQQTMKTAQQDMEFVMRQKASEKQRLIKKLQDVFQKIDRSGCGAVSWHEFQRHLTGTTMRTLLSALDVDAGDTSNIFQLMDDGDGMLTAQEFVTGVISLKGSAKAFDLVTALANLRRIERKVDIVLNGIPYPQRSDLPNCQVRSNDRDGESLDPDEIQLVL